MSKKKVLIVEDDADVRRGYSILLRTHNYEAVFAGDGTAAISEAVKEQPDLIILDIGLPAGDGFVVLGWLRSNMKLATIPVIVVSAREPQQNKQRALEAGAKAYLQKPWKKDELLGVVARLLSGPD